MRIALDAMGGDYAPREIVAGALQAARALDGIERIILVGDEESVRRECMAAGGMPSNVEIAHASQNIGMDESPASAVRHKKDSSINRAVDLVKAGRAEAMISAGSTGAVVVAATLKLRTLSGVERPAIATIMPTTSKPFVLIDAGANTDCSPFLLKQFAAMGTVYAREVLKIENPLVGLVSVGTESTKGNEITKETFRLLASSRLNFKGNIEGHDLFRGNVDVVVCDGFVGNVILKTSESVGHAVATWMKREFMSNPLRMLGAFCLRAPLNMMRRTMNPELYGGAPLLGVNGVCIICHGASSARAIFHAIRVARDSVRHQTNDMIIQTIGNLT